MKEEAKRWLLLAKDDLESAEKNLDIGIYYVCVFLCQQSAEKALKGVIINNSGTLIKIHDLITLGKKANLPEELLDSCEKINGIYTDVRYGDTSEKLPKEKFTKGIAEEFLKETKEIVSWVEKHM